MNITKSQQLYKHYITINPSLPVQPGGMQTPHLLHYHYSTITSTTRQSTAIMCWLRAGNINAICWQGTQTAATLLTDEQNNSTVHHNPSY